MRYLLHFLSTLFVCGVMTEVVFATTPLQLNLSKAESTMMTVYPQQGLVNQSFSVRLPAAQAKINLPVDIPFWQLDTLSLKASSAQYVTHPESIAWKTSQVSAERLLDSLIGKNMTISLPKSNVAIKGKLTYWHKNTGVLTGADNQMTLFTWQQGMFVTTHQSSSVLNGFKKVVEQQDILSAFFQLQSPVSQLDLSYVNRGLTVSNNYHMVWNEKRQTASLALNSTVQNNSDSTYLNSKLTLAFGDMGNQQPVYKKNFVLLQGDGMSSTADQRSPQGNLQFIPVKGVFDLASKSKTKLNLFSVENFQAKNHYEYVFNGEYGRTSSETEHPQSVLIFTTPKDLPDGNVQLYTQLGKTMLMTGNSHINATAKSGQVSLSTGDAYTIDVIRKRINVKRTVHDTQYFWALSLTNHTNNFAVVVIKDQSINLAHLSGAGANHNTIKVKLKPKEVRHINFSSVYSQSNLNHGG